MKRYYSLFVIFVFIGMLILFISANAGTGGSGGNLGCSDLSNCSGSASCNSKGTVQNCTITCQDGSSISCPVPQN